MKLTKQKKLNGSKAIAPKRMAIGCVILRSTGRCITVSAESTNDSINLSKTPKRSR